MSADPALATVRQLIMRPGTVNRFHDAADVYNAMVVAREAKASGHAVMVDETYNALKEFVEAHVVHYKSCTKCARQGGA